MNKKYLSPSFWLPAALLTGLLLVGASCEPGTVSSSASLTAVPVRAGFGPAPTALESLRYRTDVLLFVGKGTWSAEVASLKGILEQHGLTYRALTSEELDALTLDELASFGLILFPGGSGTKQTRGLQPATRARLREAVQIRGVSYLGFCAGSFVAVAPAPATAGADVAYGIGLVQLPELPYYYLEFRLDPDIAMVEARFPNGERRDLLWYGGPTTPEFPLSVVARYPNGDPMMTELWSGNGFVLLSATHPAAPQSVKAEAGLDDADGPDDDVAFRLIDAALHRRPLPVF